MKGCACLMRLAAVAMVGCGITVLVGCASEKRVPESAEAPKPQPVSLAQIKSELLQTKTQLGVTTNSLNTLAKSSTADADANYNKFSEEYLKLQAKADFLKGRAQDLKAKSAAYYDLWNKQAEVENPELQRQALQQKADAEKVYSSIRNEMQLARNAFNPYMSNLKDVGNYLRGHLTPASLQSISGLVAKANDQAKEVNVHIDAIVGSIDKMSSATGEGAKPMTANP